MSSKTQQITKAKNTSNAAKKGLIRTKYRLDPI